MAQAQQFNFETVWPELKNTVEVIIKICQNTVTDQKITYNTWSDLFNKVYTWCIKGDANKKAELYNNVIKIFKEFAAIEKKHLVDKRGDELLRDYLKRFQSFTSATGKLRKMFGYMHSYWIPERVKANDASVREMYEMSLLNWREAVFEPLQQQVIGALLSLITTDRDGKGGDKILLKNMLDSIVSIGVKETQPVLYYKQAFQDPFIAKTKEYYTSESTEYIAKNPIAQYMIQAEQRIVQEEALATSYLHPTTKPDLIKTMEVTLIDQHNKPMQEAFQVFLKDKDSAEDMRRFYFLLSRIEKGLDRSAETFKGFLQGQGQNILKEHGSGLMGQNAQKNAMELTKALVALHVKYTDINKTCFSDHVLFRDALDKAFTVIMNPDKTFLDQYLAGGRVGLPEVLNMYADHLLRGNEKEIREEELDKRFDSIVKMFSYLDDKDLFYKLFKAKLARRLLGKFRDEQEQSFLGKLKQQEGAGQELRSLEGMFNDVRLGSSNEKLAEWEEFLKRGDAGTAKMKTTILPLFEQNWSAVIRPVNLNMPVEFQQVQKKYNEFTNRNSEREPNSIKKVISWIYQEGTCEIVTTTVNEKKKKQRVTLVVSPVQAAVLYLFNNKNQIKFEELRSELNMNEDALKFCLHPLVFHKYRVLVNAGPTGKGKEKPPEGKKLKITELFDADDIILAPPKMTTEGKSKIQYPPGPGIMDTDTTNRINEQVKRERAILIDLAVVRIMKARNKAPIKNVVGEVIQQLVKFFQPQQKDIMRRIQSLIERSFVRRDDEDHTQLIYVA